METLDLFAEINALTAERDILKARLGPAGAKMLMDLKMELDQWREYSEKLREALEKYRNIVCRETVNGGDWAAREALSIKRPGSSE